MAIRMTGLTSGLDTESIVAALMSAQSLKKTKIERAKTKLEWKQTKWADLNTKLKSLYTNQVSKLQLSTAYKTKKTSVSDPTKANVTASTSAANGSYELEITSIAKSQYLTGGKTKATSTSTKISELEGSSDLVGKELKVTAGGNTSYITVTKDMTISDFTTQLKNAGLNASYDTSQQRFFISSKDSGKANAFSLEVLSEGAQTARSDLKSAVDYDSMTSANKAIVDSAMTTLSTSGTDTDEYESALDSIAKAAYETKNSIAADGAATYIKAKLYAENYASKKADAEDTLKSDYFEDDGQTIKSELVDGYKTDYAALSDDEKAELGDNGVSEDAYVAWRSETTRTEYKEAVESKADSDTTDYVNEQFKAITAKEEGQGDSDLENEYNKARIDGLSASDITSGIGVSVDASGTDNSSEAVQKAMSKYYGTSGTYDTVSGFSGTSVYSGLSNTLKEQLADNTTGAVYLYASSGENAASSGNELSVLGLANVTSSSSSGTIAGDGYLMAAEDSKIKLNGAELTSSATTISANGLSIELTGLTNGQAITFSVATDVDAIYNTIKSALTEYNTIMKEMYDAYNADSASDYEPLSSEEKEAMTDDDIELWENKIKDSLLKGDTTLNSVMQAMRNAMQTQVEYNGKKYSLASFGIMTSTDYTEGGQYHIYGDEDDSTYADYTDKLKTALEEDPDTVVNVLSGIFGKLRTAMSNKMAGSKVSSAQTFYNDLKIKSDISDYEDEISDWEDKLADMEDSYYDKFTAMETALTKLQSQQSSLSSLFGS